MGQRFSGSTNFSVSFSSEKEAFIAKDPLRGVSVSGPTESDARNNLKFVIKTLSSDLRDGVLD